jgi:hypothetical protein
MKRIVQRMKWILIIGLLLAGCTGAGDFQVGWIKPDHAEIIQSITLADAQNLLQGYLAELDDYNQAFTIYRLPEIDFFQFGMGNREKMIYKDGKLIDSFSETILREWDISNEVIIPSEYLVVLETKTGSLVHITENHQGVWVEENGRFMRLSKGSLNLPQFEDSPYPQIMRVLHHEVLINIVDGFPTPNYLVYPKPWYRDAALAAMVLEKTDNLHLIKSWIEGIREPFDRNNAGIEEPDNLGQVLFLVSLVSDKDHPVVSTILGILPQFEKDNHIEGLTDFSTHSVYQTLWLKYGLSALGLADEYEIPQVKDSYASLFWMDYHDQIIVGQTVFDSPSYPYLMTAQDHFFGTKNGYVSSRPYPLTWEANASAAQYEGMAVISDDYLQAQLAAPHGWHAAELFLLLVQD